MKKASTLSVLTFPFCRGGGIRTPGTSRYNGFQDRRIRPLCHASVISAISFVAFATFLTHSSGGSAAFDPQWNWTLPRLCDLCNIFRSFCYLLTHSSGGSAAFDPQWSCTLPRLCNLFFEYRSTLL